MMSTMQGEPVTFRDAIGNVEVLDDISLPDSQPCIEAQPLSIQCRANMDTNFEDKNAFVFGNSKYIEEAHRHANLNKLLEDGFEHAVHLYTWRCCSRAVPMAKSNDQPNRTEIYKKTVEVLSPEVNKLLHLMYFQQKAIDCFCDEVRRLCHPEKRKDFVSEAYLYTLGKLINMFAVLDELKNMKASIKNDYSTFRRSAQYLQVLSDTQTLQESQNLSMFLATQNKIRDGLRQNLQKIEGFEELLADVINLCCYLFDNAMYITPNEKHMLVKVLGFGLFLMDGGELPVVARLDQKKRISIPRLDKIFKQMQVVPLFGDMQIMPFAFVKKSSHYDAKSWPGAHVDSELCQINIIVRLRKIREEHTDFVTHLARIHNEMAINEKDTPRSDAENAELTTLTLRGLQLLGAWTADVLEMVSWKLLHPTDPRTNEFCPQDSEEYERVTKYNYTVEEKAALIEVISMIKGLQMTLGKMECELQQAVRRHVYAELQDFVQITLREPLRKAIKNKKDFLKSILAAVRDTCVDPVPGQENIEDMIMKKRKDHGSAGDIRTMRRPVPPSSTQLYMVRTMLESLLSDRSGGKRTMRKEIEAQHLFCIETFLKNSFYYPPLLAFSETLEECCDLSQLWYREFYLEMTMGKRIQFPIEMSMPWILTDHILTSKDPSLIECALYQLDLYNDSAQYALMKFRKQFLYDEVEAEVNLCFDQFVFKMSDQVFSYYKQLAAGIMLDERFRHECQQAGIHINIPPCTRYKTLLRQRHVQLLGRSIDLNRLVTQRVNLAMSKSLDIAISRFEAEDITAIVELEGMLTVNRLCHKMLKEVLPGLNDFKAMLLEANHNVSAPYGRITLHVFWELNYDFLPSYNYNASTWRFVKMRANGVTLSQAVQRDKHPQAAWSYFWGSKSLNAAYSNIYSMYSQFVGAEHFRAMVRLLGYQGIAVVLEELMKICQTLLQGSIQQYAKALMKVMPKQCKLPKYDYGSKGILSYYYANLQDIVGSSDLRTEMFQSFRELGNCILFCLLMEQALSQEEVTDLLHAAPFQSTIPRPYSKDPKEAEMKIKKLEAKYCKMNVSSVIEQMGSREQAQSSREADLLTKERLCCGLTLFEVLLSRIRTFMNDPVWTGPPPSNGVMAVDECSQFHRLWSAIQFVYCLPHNENQFTIEQMFGEGLHWAGCTMIVLLGQQKTFDALDFCYHIYRVHRVDNKDDNVKGIGQLTRVVERIRRFQTLNNQIFGVLNKYLRTGETDADGQVNVEHVRCFQPPVHHSHASNR